MSVEGIRELVKQEKESEEALQRAKEKATKIIEEAKLRAKRILEEAEDGMFYDELLKKEMDKIEKKKQAAEKESDDALKELEKTANINMDETVAFIVKQVLGG
jgi:vacuolar-type H+-ATPase subunit H